MTETTQTNQHSLVAQLRSHLRMPLYRNGYILTLNAIVTSGLGLVYWILATRYYNSATVGINSALLAAVTLLSGGAQLSLNSAMVRFIPVAGRATLRLVGYVYLVTSMFAAIAGLVFGISAGAWSPTLRFLSQHPVWLSLFVISTLAWCIFSLQDSVMTGLRQPVWILVENGVCGLVKIVLLMIFVTRMPDYGIFASWLISITLSLFPVNALIFRRLIPIHARADSVQQQPVHLHQVLRYVSGNYPAWLFYLASTTLLPIIVADQIGARASAYFYLPWMITNSL
jgi:O-antigen/teichoic acid export membrane protein